MKISNARLTQIKETASTSWKMVKFVWSVDWKLFLGSLVAILIPAVIPFINIYIYKLVIDLVVAVVSGAPFDHNQFYPLIGLRIATYFVQNLAFNLQGFIERLLWLKVPIFLNETVLNKISSLDIYYFENDQFRDLLEKTKDSIGWRPQNLLDNIFFSAQSLLQVIIAFVALIKLNWVFVVPIVFITVPEFFLQTYRSRLSWSIWGAQTPERKRYGYLTHILQHHKEIKEIKMFSLAKSFIREARKIQEKFYGENRKVATKTFGFESGINVASTIVFIGIELYVIFLALARKVTVGDINFYTGVVSNFQNGLNGLLRNVNQIFEQSLYVKSIFEVLDLKPFVAPPDPGFRFSLRKPPTIEFKNVDFAYPGSTKNILKNFNLVIKPGEKIAFVGENGAGKSTIIKLLARFYDVDAGEILINEVNIKKLDLDDWYKSLGVLFQDFNRYEDTVGKNIYYGKVYEKYDLNKISHAASQSGASSMIGTLDKKYEQMLGKMFKEGVELSGGQWQKIALSRAFFRSAPILVLDEPTSAIDAKAEAEIFDRVERLSKDKTVIIISHRFSTVRNADKIYVVENGKIAESGDHKTLIKLDGQYAALFRLQAKGYQ